MKKFITLTLLSLSLLSCDDKSKSMPKKQEEVYDFRDEKYQDFYSRLYCLIRSILSSFFGIEPSDDMLFKLMIDRYSKLNGFLVKIKRL